MFIIRLSHFILFLIIFSSCEEDYFVQSEDFTPSIVLNSVFTADSTWIVDLNTSRNVFDSQSKSLPIEDASVIITKSNGEYVCPLIHIEKGRYVSQSCYPSSESTYKIKVYSNKYGEVEATSSLPEKAEIELIKIDTSGDNAVIDFSIFEKSTINNYYIWDLVDVTIEKKVIIEKDGNGGTRIDMTTWVENLNQNVTHIKNKNLTSSISAAWNNFENGSYSTSLQADKSIISNENDVDSSFTEVKTMLRIMTVSEELFQYFKSIENYLSYEDYFASFTEPSTVYSNVKGGAGIFAGYTVEYLDIQ